MLIWWSRCGAKAKTPDRFVLSDAASVDEGDTETVAILASGEQADKVGSVMVSVTGDALLSLWQGRRHAGGGR